MHCTLAELAQRMSAKEYILWFAENEIEPFGEERADLRSGMQVQSNLAPFVDGKVELKDCMLNFEPPKKQDWRDWKNALHKRTLAMGGKVK